MNLWVLGMRVRTLPAAIVPVLVGAAAAVGEGSLVLPAVKVALALVVAVGMQVGVNYANDYSDGMRGTDTNRVGPTRLVGSGLASPSQVKLAAALAFAIASAAGLVLAATTSWWLILVGSACVIAAIGYTGGPLPYGYHGLGELFVLVFFGLVATVGTTYVLVERLKWFYIWMGLAVGCWAVALLLINNLRDIPNDKANKKITLAVRLGEKRTRILYVITLTLPYLICAASSATGRSTSITLIALPLAIRAIVRLRAATDAHALIGVLAKTAQVQLISGTILALGLALSG